ncbi:ABC transporter periplasmic binding protein [Salmonella enterica subsp. enterica]|nr:ABC transporter periplasmic binding protein [Salmonella enterica subsp. enterica] [Salmonella enterica subsp. enterica serovar Menston]
MQLRKLTTAMLVMGLSAGLAHAEDGAPAAGSTLDKIAKNGGDRRRASRIFLCPFLITTTSRKWSAIPRTTPTPLWKR